MLREQVIGNEETYREYCQKTDKQWEVIMKSHPDRIIAENISYSFIRESYEKRGE